MGLESACGGITEKGCATEAALSVLDTSSLDLSLVNGVLSGAVNPAGVDHNSLANLTTGDPHTQYALLAGRASGQTLIGGTASGDDLILQSTSDATRGSIFLGASSAYDEVNTRLGIGITGPTSTFEATRNGSGFKFTGAINQSQLTGYTPEVTNNTARWAASVSNAALSNSTAFGDILFTVTDADPNPLKGSIQFRTNRGDSLQTAMTVTDAGLVGVGNTPTAVVDAAASTTARASIRMREGTAPTSPNAGDMWADSTQKTMYSFSAGVNQSRPGVLFTQTADKTVTNTVTETSIIGTGVGTVTLPANFFVPGKTARIRCGGTYSTPALGTPAATVRVKYGTTVIASATTTSLITSASALEFDGEVCITCRTASAAGTVAVHGDIEYATGLGGQIAVNPLNNGGVAATINTTTSNALDVTVQWDSASTDRIAKSTVTTVEVLN